MYERTPKIPINFISPSINLSIPEDMDEYVAKMTTKLKSVFKLKLVIKNRNFCMNKAKIRHDRKLRAKRYKIGDQ